MKFQLLCLVFILSLLINSIFTTTLSSTQITSILNAHNNARRAVIPAASNMVDLVYDSALANVASNYLNKCIYDHNSARTTDYGTGVYVGENLYMTSSTNANVDVVSPVTLWVNEKADYTFDTNSCAAGKACGHYTQVVWAASTKLGCGYAICPTGTIVGCNYAPGGNYNGQSPYIKSTSPTAPAPRAPTPTAPVPAPRAPVPAPRAPTPTAPVPAPRAPTPTAPAPRAPVPAPRAPTPTAPVPAPRAPTPTAPAPRAPVPAPRAPTPTSTCTPTCGNYATCNSGVCVCITGYTLQNSVCTAVTSSPSFSLSSWSQVVPSTGSDWAIVGSTIQMINTASTTQQRKIVWTNSPSYSEDAFTGFSSKITTSGNGEVGLGLRYGQGTSRLTDSAMWKLTVSNGVASVSLCMVYYGGDNCNVYATNVPWANNVAHEFKLTYETDATNIILKIYVDGILSLGGYSNVFISKSYYPTLGSAHLYASMGSVTTFSDVAVFTKTNLRITLSRCMSDAEWITYVANILSIPSANVQIRSTSTDNAKCNKRESFTAVTVTITGTVAQSSSSLASQFSYLVLVGDLAVVEVSAATASTFIAIAEGTSAIATPAAASLGLIVGASVGGAVGLAAIGGIIAAVVVKSMKKGEDEKEEVEQEVDNPVRQTIVDYYEPKSKKPVGGVDLLDMDPSNHKSITARGQGAKK